MTTKELNVDALSEILDAYKINIAPELIASIADDFMMHISCMNDIENIRHAPSKNPVCAKCQSKDAQIKRLEYEIDCYENSVKKRTGAEYVGIKDGDVRYANRLMDL